jgi:hypothetical protein
MVSVARAVLGHGGQDVVVKGLLVVIHELRVLVEHEQLTAELEHVVGGAGFVLRIGGKAV